MPPPNNSTVSAETKRSYLEALITSGLDAEVERIIKKHQLKYRIGEKTRQAFDIQTNELRTEKYRCLIETGDTTQAWLDRFITQDPRMIEMKQEVLKLATEHDPVLIFGATGTGKELIAQALHGDKEDEFLPLNCAGMPESLIESELFGHVKGAFTGAESNHDGLLKAAKTGTVFLDEIGEMPMSVQAKLLRVIQARKIRPVGGTKHYDMQCRVICATNRDLLDMCSRDEFRVDLYARLSTFIIELSPLSERPQDIPAILNSLPYGQEFYAAFLARKKLLEDKDPTVNIKMETPFNVRSLEQYVKRYKVLGKLPI